MTSLELDAEESKRELGEAQLGHALHERAAREDDKPTRCPKCGGRARVEEKKRPRTIQTLSGKHTYKRNYFRCFDCRHGFAPVDDELGIPADGAVTLEVEKRILDFGLNDVFDEGAARSRCTTGGRSRTIWFVASSIGSQIASSPYRSRRYKSRC